MWIQVEIILTFFPLSTVAGLLVGPIAGLTLIIGNVVVILGLFPSHVAWTIYTLVKYILIFQLSFSQLLSMNLLPF